jgi:hypothetical protein
LLASESLDKNSFRLSAPAKSAKGQDNPLEQIVKIINVDRDAHDPGSTCLPGSKPKPPQPGLISCHSSGDHLLQAPAPLEYSIVRLICAVT